jgi:hypothetical protein
MVIDKITYLCNRIVCENLTAESFGRFSYIPREYSLCTNPKDIAPVAKRKINSAVVL